MFETTKNYRVYSDGRVFSKTCNRFIKSNIVTYKGKTISRTRLICELFVPNPDNYKFPRFNKDKGYFWSNLRNDKIIPKQVICLNTGEIYKSVSEASRIIGKDKGNLSRHLNGKKSFKSIGKLQGKKLFWKFKK